MSAGGNAACVVSSCDGLAPKFAAALVATIEQCHAEGLDAVIFETTRSDALAQVYYRRGRPPSAEFPSPVTNAPDASWTWHGYGLAADIISASREWNAGQSWFTEMGRIAKANGLDWGGDWNHPDLPHVQFGTLKASPSEQSRSLYPGHIAEVWALVGAA